jgi:7-carboxy-7-deazaguanine synthase
VAREACEVVVKVVITPSTQDVELEELAKRIAAIDPATPVIVQPVTPTGPVKRAPDARRLLAIAVRLGETLADVRLIPQTHPLLGVP